MERILPTVWISVLIYIFSVALAADQTTTTAPAAAAVADDCGSYKTNQTSCCGIKDEINKTACMFYTCANTTGCVAVSVNVSGISCQQPSTTPEFKCNAPPVDCTALINETQCCSAQNPDNSTACNFYMCKDTPTCNNASDTAFTCPEEKSPPANKCPAPPVDCTKLANESSCCKPMKDNITAECSFYKCTDKSFCVNSTETSVKCPDSTPPTPVDECVPSTTTSTPTTPTTITTTKQAPTTANSTIITTSTVAPTTSAAPTASPAPSTGDGGQSFDAASFIGGIVLCAGMVAIAYFGLKFYRARQERNYHTL